MSTVSKRCYILFPEEFHLLGEGLCISLEVEFGVNFHPISYRYPYLTNGVSNRVNNVLKNDSILIFMYVNNLSTACCYKLGIAHAHNRHVILISLKESIEIISDIPRFIRYVKQIPMLIENFDDRGIFAQRFYKVHEDLTSTIRNIEIQKDKAIFCYRKILDSCNQYYKETYERINLPDESECIQKINAAEKLVDKLISLSTGGTLYYSCYADLLCLVLDKRDAIRLILNFPKDSQKHLLNSFRSLMESNVQQSDIYSQSEIMTDSKYQINANNVQIVETTAGGDAVIHKYASEPQVNEALVILVHFLQEVQQKHPEATPETTEFILNAEARTMEQNEPQRWLQFQQQLCCLPQDIRDPERWKQGGKNALIQVTTDLADNIFLNAVVAFLDGFSGEG